MSNKIALVTGANRFIFLHFILDEKEPDRSESDLSGSFFVAYLLKRIP